MPGGCSGGTIVRSIETPAACGVRHAQPRSRVRRNSFRAHVGTQEIRPIGDDRDKLIDGLELLVATDRELQPQAPGASICRGGAEIQGHVRALEITPVESGIQRKTFEIAVEYSIAVIATRKRHDAVFLKIQPNSFRLHEQSAVNEFV